MILAYAELPADIYLDLATYNSVWRTEKQICGKVKGLYPPSHLFASLIIATVSLFFDQQAPFLSVELFGFNLTVFVLCIAFGVFLDIDHVVDYFLNRDYPHENLKSQFMKGRMYVVLHGVEGAALLLVLAVVWPFLVFPAISYACHIIMDIYYNGVSFQAYFYVVRLGKRLKLHAPVNAR
jgi:hypothetical protein